MPPHQTARTRDARIRHGGMTALWREQHCARRGWLIGPKDRASAERRPTQPGAKLHFATNAIVKPNSYACQSTTRSLGARAVRRPARRSHWWRTSSRASEARRARLCWLATNAAVKKGRFHTLEIESCALERFRKCARLGRPVPARRTLPFRSSTAGRGVALVAFAECGTIGQECSFHANAQVSRDAGERSCSRSTVSSALPSAMQPSRSIVGVGAGRDGAPPETTLSSRRLHW